MTIANVILWQAFAIRAGLYLALLDRLSSLGLGLDPVPSEPALVLFGCWCKTSSSLAVVPSVSSLWTQTETYSLHSVRLEIFSAFLHQTLRKKQRQAGSEPIPSPLCAGPHLNHCHELLKLSKFLLHFLLMNLVDKVASVPQATSPTGPLAVRGSGARPFLVIQDVFVRIVVLPLVIRAIPVVLAH